MKRAAPLLVVALAGGFAGLACDHDSGRIQCLHPCDLSQTLRVEVTGAERATSVAVAAPCEPQMIDCAPFDGCRREVDFYLGNPYFTPSGDGGAQPSCHVTATAASGQIVEADAPLTYTGDPCCSGWEFYQPLVSIAFSPADGAVD